MRRADRNAILYHTMRKKLVRTGVPSAKRSAKLRKVVEQAHRKYAGVFKRLAE